MNREELERERKREQQRRADAKWIAKNREHRTYLSNRSSARSFIRNWAKLEDLDEMEKIIAEKRKKLKNLEEKA